jgi:hypothetical protein
VKTRQRITRRTSAKELFKIVDDFMKEKSIKWLGCFGLCMDAVVVGSNEGLQA